MKYNIYHPMGGALNHDLKRGQYQYELVSSVDCTTLAQAFMLSQNDFNEDWRKLNHRSTSVGDIIVDVTAEEHYFVAGTEFIKIPNTVVTYIDWGNDQLSQEDLKNESELNALENQSSEQ